MYECVRLEKKTLNNSLIRGNEKPWIIRFNRDSLLTLLFIIYFCREPIVSIFSHIFGSGVAGWVHIFLFLIIFSLYCVCGDFKNLGTTIVCYALIGVAVLMTMLFHPEYNSWFFYSEANRYYSLQTRFLSPKGALWAFAVVTFFYDIEKLRKCLKYTAFILFAYYVVRYVQATIQGYWVVLDANLQSSQSAYNLDFGYNLLFPMAYFASVALLEKKKTYYIPYIGGLFLAIMSGSRGAFLVGGIILPTIFPFMWNNLTKKEKRIMSLVLILILPFIIIVFLNFNTIISVAAQMMIDRGFSSRTLLSIIQGTFSEGNGRERIYEMALELIRTGGPFGRGVYGDRTTIGQYYAWGYSHNIILEILVSFGWLLGGILIILLVGCLINCFIKWCTTNDDRICFVMMFIPSLKLLFSSSFWYVPQFWGMLALIIILRRRYKAKGLII